MHNVIKVTLILFLICINSVSANEWKHMAKGSQLLKQGNALKAIKEFEKALDKNPSMIEAYQKIGYIYQYEIEDCKKAIKVYLEGLKYAPNDYQLNLNLMYSYFETNQIEKAVNIYKKTASIRPKDVRFSFPRDKLNLYLEGTNYSEKIEFCQDLLALNPTDTIIRKFLAETYLKQKNYNKAKNQYEALIKYGDSLGSIYYGLGISNYYLGKYDLALDNLSKARELGEYVPDQYFEMVKGKLQEK